MAAPEKKAGKLEEGASVVLKGLANKPENNGRRGHITGYSEEKERYVVKLLSGKDVHVKASNLEFVDEPVVKAPPPAEVPLPSGQAPENPGAVPKGSVSRPAGGVFAVRPAAVAGGSWPMPAGKVDPMLRQAALAKAIATSNPVDVLTALTCDQSALQKPAAKPKAAIAPKPAITPRATIVPRAGIVPTAAVGPKATIVPKAATVPSAGIGPKATVVPKAGVVTGPAPAGRVTIRPAGAPLAAGPVAAQGRVPERSRSRSRGREESKEESKDESKEEGKEEGKEESKAEKEDQCGQGRSASPAKKEDQPPAKKPAQGPAVAAKAGPVKGGQWVQAKPAGATTTPAATTAPSVASGNAKAADAAAARSSTSVAASLLPSFPGIPKEWQLELRAVRIEGTPREPRGAGVIAFRLPLGQTEPPADSSLCVCVVEKAPKWMCPKCKALSYDTWMSCQGCSATRPSSMGRFVAGGKEKGPHGFPKGGREQADKGCVVANALREWDEETGLDRDRLQLVPRKHFDDVAMGVRFLLGLCKSTEDDGEPDESESGGAGEASWKPPEADLSCLGGHAMQAKKASDTVPCCSKCAKWVPGHEIVLCCDMCVYSVCKGCQDPDPIVMAHWMRVDRAKRQLPEARRVLLERALRELRAPRR